jgi:hypothetical protein
VQLSVDDERDFQRCRAIIEQLDGRPAQAGWRACVAAYDRVLAAEAP